jgi:hypothetical protein
MEREPGAQRFCEVRCHGNFTACKGCQQVGKRNGVEV